MNKYLMCDLHYRMAVAGIKSLAELQRVSGVNRVTLTKLFNNESQRLDYQTVVELCEVLECGVDELFLIIDEDWHEEQRETIQKRREEAKKGVVYFLQDEALGLVKIGRTSHLETRKSHLERQYKSKLKVLHTIPTDNTILLEKEMHNHFKDYRFEGEWFRITKKDIEGIKKVR